MLDAIRRGQRWLTALLVGGVGFVFVVVFGNQGPGNVSTSSATSIVELGDFVVDAAEFDLERESQARRLRDQLGEQFDERAAGAFLDQQVLRVIVERTVLAQSAHELGLEVPKAEIQRYLRDTYRSPDGTVDEEAIVRGIERVYGTQRLFLQAIERDLLAQKMLRLLASQITVSEPELEAVARQLAEEARIAYVAQSAAAASTPASSRNPMETVMVAPAARPETDGLLPTVGWSRTGAGTTFAVERGVYDAGAALQWARGIGLYSSHDELAGFDGPSGLARGIVFVPALSGLAAPYWDRDAAPLFIGMDHATDRRDLVRAVLEGIAMLTVGLLDAAAPVVPAGHPVSIDGGLSASPYFARFLAAASGRRIVVPRMHELTALGLAELAGAEVREIRGQAAVFEPEAMVSGDDQARFAEAVARARGWRGL